MLGTIQRLAPSFGEDIRATFGFATINDSFDRKALFPINPDQQAGLRKALSALAQPSCTS